MKPLITIVIPVYNREKVVQDTLDSIYNQTYRPMRVVLVDNASTDASMEVIRGWAQRVDSPDLQVSVIDCSTPGAAAARNKGLEMVDTEWVMFFDSDDTMKPYHVQKAMAGTRPSADVIGWDVRLHMLNGHTSKKRFYDHKQLYNCILKGSFATQRYMARTQIVKAVGGWDPTVGTWDDIELGTRIISQARGIKYKRLRGKPSVDVYQSEESITGVSYHERRDAEEYALQCMARNVGPFNIDLIYLKSVILAACYAREGYTKDGHRLRNDVLAHNTVFVKGLLYRFAYYYTRCRLPGITTLLRPFF